MQVHAISLSDNRHELFRFLHYMISHILSNAWRIYRARFVTIALVVITIWLPCELVDNYCVYFVFDPDDFRGPLKLYQFLENFFGIIATAGVTYLALNRAEGCDVGYGEALTTGLKSWGRMWITRFLYGVSVLLGLVLLILPGIYLATRFAFAETIVVAEGVCGTSALGRSFELTRNRFWPVFWLIVLTVLILTPPVLLLALLPDLVPALDHWLVSAGLMLLCDVATAFATVVFTCGYRTFARQEDETLAKGVHA